MIVDSTETLRKHISINGDTKFDNVLPYTKQAQRKFLKPIIGKAGLSFLDDYTDSDPVVLDAIELAEEAISNYAYYLYLPIGAVQIGDAGIFAAEMEGARSASDKQFKELQRSFLRASHEALDELLEFMEESPDKFEAWVNSNEFSVYKDLLVNKTKVFNTYHHIFNSRQTFMALQPTIITVEDQYISPAIGAELLDALKSDQTVAERKQVKQYLQQSIVAFTVMKTVNNGMFVMDAKGMHMRFDELPYEKTVTNINLKINDFLLRTKDSKENEGIEYLRKAQKLIEANLDKFEEFQAKESKASVKVYKGKGIVGF